MLAVSFDGMISIALPDSPLMKMVGGDCPLLLTSANPKNSQYHFDRESVSFAQIARWSMPLYIAFFSFSDTNEIVYDEAMRNPVLSPSALPTGIG
jgi:hypothetical protein